RAMRQLSPRFDGKKTQTQVRNGERNPKGHRRLRVPELLRFSSNNKPPDKENFMQERRLGKNGPLVSALGLGCMGMSYAYGPTDEAESLRVLHRYVELGGNFLDTAEIYGPHKNEELLGKFLREVPRDNIFVATKFGFRFGPSGISGVD